MREGVFVPAGYREIEVGEMITDVAIFMPNGELFWKPVVGNVTHRINTKLPRGLVPFAVPITESPKGNKYVDTL